MPATPSILILVDWFVPGYRAGGPIQSCVNVAFILKDNYQIKVLTTDTDFGSSTPYPDVPGNQWTHSLNPSISVYYMQKKGLSAKQIRDILLQTDAEFIYLNHLFSPLFVVYPLWLKWKGIVKSKFVVCPRGALYQSALSVKRYKKTPFLKLFKWMGLHKMVRFHATSEREKQAILDFFPGSEVMVADDLPSTKQPDFITLAKTPGALKCIFIARIHPIKNLLLLLTVLKMAKASVQLTIIGPVEDEAYWQKCQLAMSELPANVSAEYVGAVPNHALLPLLQQHHLLILPTLGENFGHSIFESLLVGRPVLISDQTPWLQLHAQKAGWDLPLDNPDSFTAAIETAAAWDQVIFDQWCHSAWLYAKKFIENPDLKKHYLQLFS